MSLDSWHRNRERVLTAQRLRKRLNSFLTFTKEGSWDWMKEAVEFRTSEYAAMFDLKDQTASQRLQRAFRNGLIDRRHDPKNSGRYLFSVPADAEDRLRNL